MAGRVVAVGKRSIDFEIDYEGPFLYDLNDYFTLGPSKRYHPGTTLLVRNQWVSRAVPPEHAGRRTRPEFNSIFIKAHTTYERNRGSDPEVHPRGFHFLVEEHGNPDAPPIHVHVSVVPALTAPPLPDAIPPRPAALLVGDAPPRVRHPMQCRCVLKLGPGDDGTADVVAYTSRYIMPGQLFLLPDGHQGTVRGVRPLYMHASGERYASVLYLTNITAREKPAGACIADPPSRVATDTQMLLHPCTVTPGANYEWAAYDEKGNAVGTWTRSNAANGVWTAPNAPGVVHITLSMTADGHEHLDGALVWVEPPASDYAPVPIPQPVQPGDPANRKRYQVDVRYEGMSIELSGADITFSTGDGLPIAAEIRNPPVGPFDFYAEGPTGMNGQMEVTLHGVVHVSLFTL